MNCWVNLWVRVCSGRGWVSLGFGERKSPCGVCRSFGTVGFQSTTNKRPDLCEPIVVTLPSATTARDLSPSRPARKSAHRNVASNNLRRLQRINSQDERVSLRVEGDRVPERLQLAADEAARSGDLRTTIEYASGAKHTVQLWNEFRIWDPGD